MSKQLSETIEGQTPFDEDYRADLIPAYVSTLGLRQHGVFFWPVAPTTDARH